MRSIVLKKKRSRDRDNEMSDLESIGNLESIDTPDSSLPPGTYAKQKSIKLKGLKTGLGSSVIPAIILDTKLNIVWENSHYRKLFVDNGRMLPVNLVKDFSPFIDTRKLNEILTSLGDKETGFSYIGRLESKHRSRLTILVNIMITPLFKHDGTGKNSKPSFYTALFDDISQEHKTLLQNTFLSLLEASKLKDNDTGNHIKRVGEYSRVLAAKLFGKQEYQEVDREFIENILFLAPMHDVGKIGTPDDILNKQGPLDDREWNIMKEHTKNGAYILQAYPDPMAKDIAVFHHEKWNGEGYPFGISGKQIPLAPRIVAIADVYDALRMKRSYKEPFTHKDSVSIILKDSGSHFDPSLVEVFTEVADDFRDIFERLKDF